jgi:hypothetical protein
MRHVVLGLLFLLVLNGCMTAANVGNLPPARASAVKTVGVVSVIGDKLAFGSQGMFRFNNTEGLPDIGNWKIDDFVVGQVKANLRPDIQVVTASYPPAALNVDDIH